MSQLIMINKRVETNSRVLAGKPVIRGTRIPVSLVTNLVRHGYTIDKICQLYPELDAQDIEAVLTYRRKSRYEN